VTEKERGRRAGRPGHDRGDSLLTLLEESSVSQAGIGDPDDVPFQPWEARLAWAFWRLVLERPEPLRQTSRDKYASLCEAGFEGHEIVALAADLEDAGHSYTVAQMAATLRLRRQAALEKEGTAS
jgi:hypothetical protein